MSDTAKKARASDPRADLSIDEGVDVQPNPEVEHVASVASRTKAAQGGNEMSTVHHRSNPRLSVTQDPAEGATYVTRNQPDVIVQVLPSQNVVVGNDDHEVSVPGNYLGDDPDNNTLKMHGPTAHMLEVRGVVRILGVAKRQCSAPVVPDAEGGEEA